MLFSINLSTSTSNISYKHLYFDMFYSRRLSWCYCVSIFVTYKQQNVLPIYAMFDEYVVLGFNVQPTTTCNVIRRRELGLKSHLKDWRSPVSNVRTLCYKASSFTTTPGRLLSLHMSHFICKNKDADQLRDLRLCFCNTDSTIPLIPKSEISNI